MHFRIWYYMHNLVRDHFINSDGFLLQAACAFIDPDALWTRVLASFGFEFTNRIEALHSSSLWFFTDQAQTAPPLFEGFLMLMLSFITGSWSPAFVVGFSDSECDVSRIRTEICSVLSTKDRTYSELQRVLPRAVSSHPSYDLVLESVTSFTPPSSRTLKEGAFRLLPSAYEHHFSAVRVYFSAYRLQDVETAILNWSAQFNSPSIQVGTSDTIPRVVRFVCSNDDPIACDYFPLIFCDTFWQTLGCLCFSLCSSFDRNHNTNILHLPAAFAQAAVDAALRSSRQREVFHKMNQPIATFAWRLSVDESLEVVTGGTTPVLTCIYDSLQVIRDKADSDKSLGCLALAYNYTLHCIQELGAVIGDINGAAVRSRESDPDISRKRSTAMAARQSAIARIRLLQQSFSHSMNETDVSSPLRGVIAIRRQASDSVLPLVVTQPDKEFLELHCANSTQNDETGASISTATQSLFNNHYAPLKYVGDDSCADDLGCCCICTMEADHNDPLGLLVSISADPLSGRSRSFLSSLLPSDLLLTGVKVTESALIHSCGHAVHVSCMKSWVLMHLGPSSQFWHGKNCTSDICVLLVCLL
jgi:hypothetical protein